MKIGLISLSVPGHFNPMSAVARQLQSRNHDVVVLSLPVMQPLACAANLPFIPFGEKEFPTEHTSEVVDTLSRLKKQTIAKTNGLSRAAALLEEAFGLNKELSLSLRL
jgi:zeaxanthin glucosyltransferase